ncbi:MAG: DUF2589 domain-containing protein [Verrucomicrobiota bacterium]
MDFANIIGGPLMAAVKAQAASAMTTVAFIKSVGFRSPPPQKLAISQGPSAATQDSDVMEPVYVSFKYPKEVMPYQPAVTAGLVSVSITDPGSGYTSVPAVHAMNGTTEITGITAEVDGGKVVKLVIGNLSSVWTKETKITIDPPTGTGTTNKTATATAIFREEQKPQSAVYETMALQVPLLTMLPVPYLRIEELNLEFDVKIDQTEKVDITETVNMDEEVGAGGGLGASGFSGAANFSCSISMQETGNFSNTINRKYSMNVKVRAVQAEVPAGLERILSTLQASILAQPVAAFKS